MVSPTPKTASMGKLTQEDVCVCNAELVTAGHTHVALEDFKTVTISWVHCSRLSKWMQNPKAE